jgi:hypothetical protein
MYLSWVGLAFNMFSESLPSVSWLFPETACATCFALKSAVEDHGSSACVFPR